MAEAKDIKCSFCGAGPGEDCKNVFTGTSYPQSGFETHAARSVDAEAQS